VLPRPFSFGDAVLLGRVAASVRRRMSVMARSVDTMPQELEIISFATVRQLWSWLELHHATHPGVWVHLQKTNSAEPSVSFHDVLEAGIAYGWSESTRRGQDRTSYLQKFTPRSTRGTTSDRNLSIADRLEAEGRMTPAGRQALGR
jgi:uncharacterized protein YdeI (YjbR/CyaY-like superfamily)